MLISSLRSGSGSIWAFVLPVGEGAPLGDLIAFPLRGVEIISLVLKFAIVILIAPALNDCKPNHVCSVRDSMRQLGFFCLPRGVKWYPGTLFTGWSCLAPHRGRWPRLGRVLSLLSGCLNWLICSLAPVSRAVLGFGSAAFKSVTGLTVASCALFVWFGAGSWSSICWVVVHAGCVCWWLRNTVLPAACF